MKLMYTIKETYYHEYFYSVPIKGKDYLLTLSECGFYEPRKYYRVDIITDIAEYNDELFHPFTLKRYRCEYIGKRYYTKPDLQKLTQTEKITKHLPSEDIRSESLKLAQHYKPWVNPCNTITDYIEEKLQLNIKETHSNWVILCNHSSLLLLVNEQKDVHKLIELNRSLTGDFFVALETKIHSPEKYKADTSLEKVIHDSGIFKGN